MSLSETERRIVNAYQKGFPYETRPFAVIADKLGMSEDVVIDVLSGLRERGVLSRVGAVVTPNAVSASTLAAMAVPAERLDEVAERISARPEVNHNYEREHALNLWFVLTAENRLAVLRVVSEIEKETGLEAIELPLLEAYHVDLGFKV